MTLNFLITLAAIVCFALAALGVSSRIGLIPLGLLFLTLVLLVL